MEVIWMQSANMQAKEISNEPSLDELLIGIAAGKQECLAQLYSRTRAAVYGLALSYLKNSDDAEDVTQDTFVQVWNCAASFKPQGRAMAWLMTVTRNMTLGRIRSQSRLDHMEPEEWEKLPDEHPQPQSEERILLSEMLRCLGPTESRIVTLHAVSGLKHREVAELLEIPLATELSRYHRSLKKLRTMMEGDGLL